MEMWIGKRGPLRVEKRRGEGSGKVWGITSKGGKEHQANTATKKRRVL
jgi:hypothetical protein